MPPREKAYAKINLHLAVHPRRADNYHAIESLVVFAQWGDTLTPTPTTPTDNSETESKAGEAKPTIRHTTHAPLPDPSQNTIRKALGFAQKYGHLAPHEVPQGILVDKHIPMGAGLGGGSADAAAALRMHMGNRTEQIDKTALAYEVGADVPVCLASHPQWVQGIGEITRPIEFPRTGLIIVYHPALHVATAEVFLNFDSQPPPTHPPSLPDSMPKGIDDWKTWLSTHARNDLAASALQIAPVVRPLLAALQRHPAIFFATLSGSGGACVGLCPPESSSTIRQELLADMPQGTKVIATSMAHNVATTNASRY